MAAWTGIIKHTSTLPGSALSCKCQAHASSVTLYRDCLVFYRMQEGRTYLVMRFKLSKP